MKSKILYVITIILFILLLPLFLGNSSYKRPNVYYQVYLDGNYVGTILSKEELTKYINTQTDTIRDNIKIYKNQINAIDTFKKLNKNYGETNYEAASYLIKNKKELNISADDIDSLNMYLNDKLYLLENEDIEQMKQYIEDNDIYLHTTEVYTPNGIEIKKTYTYDNNVSTVPEIYKKIVAQKSCTVAGYKFTIKYDLEDVDDLVIYTLDKDTFNDAIEKFIVVFVPEEEYKLYKSNKQSEISTVGTIIEKIYVEEDISYKAMNISVEEKIYTDSLELSNFLLYGDNYNERTVIVNRGDTIESLAFDNQISVQELLISNPQYTSRDNLIAIGTEMKIASIAPQMQVVVEKYEVFDKEVQYSTVETYDENANQGSLREIQAGENGLERITQNVKSVNGQITFIEPVDKEVIKPTVSRIISLGTKYVPNVGSIISWGWPTSTYTITSYYGYRAAIFGEGDFHTGLDISGAGWGAPVYATNNGTVQSMINYGNSGYGISVLINHNNGYWSLYGHMAGYAPGLAEGMTVTRGQLIGYVGATGWATGPHLHFEIRQCEYYSRDCFLNPYPFLLNSY